MQIRRQAQNASPARTACLKSRIAILPRDRKVGMKNACSLFFGVLLILGITFYGPSGMVQAGSDDTLFSMEICADGVAKTVLVNEDGVPVEPTQTCYHCLTCCNIAGPPPTAFGDADLSVTLLVSQAPNLSVFTPIVQKRNTRRMPRAPPVPDLLVMTAQDLIPCDQGMIGHKTRRDGRPRLKDATA